MKTTLLVIALATFWLPSCSTNGGASKSTNMGPGAVAGPASGWSAGTGGFGNVTRDPGSGIRGSGVGAGTSGSTGVSWIERPEDRR